MSSMHRLVRALEGAFEGLGVTAPSEEIERSACLIHRSMGGAGRQFHTIDHVFGFLDGADEVMILSALFHDLVYVQVDMGFPPGVGSMLEPFVEQDAVGWRLRARVAEEETAYHRLRHVFAMDEGQVLSPSTGMNEFLSALVAEICIGPIVGNSTMLKIAACIEATIPFRPSVSDKNGENQSGPFGSLEKRLVDAGASKHEAAEACSRAVRFANLDVADFCLEDTGRFLNNTWKLLPEINRSLRVQGNYSVVEYRKAIQGMEGFFSSLSPELIYHRYKNTPSEKEFRTMIEGASANLRYAREYLQAKLLAVAILEAAAFSTGGDAPLSYLMGDIPQPGEAQDRLDDLLPPLTGSVSDKGTVYQLLDSGRMSESSFDLKNSPLALFIYRQLEASEFIAMVEKTREFLKGGPEAKTYLSAWKAEIRRPILKALTTMVPTRRQALQALLDETG